jgi:hypothetical protein
MTQIYPTSLSGPLTPRNTFLANSLPKITFNGSTYSSSGNPGELFGKTPEYFSGNTLESLACLFYNNYYNAGGTPLATSSSFVPDFYVAKNYEVGLNWNYTTSGSINFNSISGATVDKYEVFYLQRSQASFLTAAGGGATANAVTGVTLGHEIVNGTQTVTGIQIYYRYLGNVTVQN